MSRKLLSAGALVAILLTPACAQDVGDKAAVEEIVREYILENPEIIEEALIALQEKERAAEVAQYTAAAEANLTALAQNPNDYSIGPADAPITVVEFFDYRCGYCKRSAEWAAALPEAYDNQVRVVFKEYPILSPESEQAALAAIAAGKQDKYIEMHLGLMALDNGTGFGPEEIDQVAQEAGIDVAKMRADMSSIDVQRTVAEAKSLARTLGISGTPNFFIGTEFVGGANMPAVEARIEAALAEIS